MGRPLPATPRTRCLEEVTKRGKAGQLTFAFGGPGQERVFAAVRL